MTVSNQNTAASGCCSTFSSAVQSASRFACWCGRGSSTALGACRDVAVKAGCAALSALKWSGNALCAGAKALGNGAGALMGAVRQYPLVAGGFGFVAAATAGWFAYNRFSPQAVK